MQTLYDILNIQKDAPAEIISAAHKALIGIHQPYADAGDEMALETLQKINKAYSILINPDMRSRYDSALKNRRDPVNSEETLKFRDAHKESPSSDNGNFRPTGQSNGGFIGDLWRGRLGLCKTYWGYGVLVGGILGAILNIVLRFITPGSTLAIVLALAFFTYLVVVYVGVWRAATQYSGWFGWAIAAKTVVALPFVGVVAAISLPSYMDYKKQSQAHTSPSSSGWDAKDKQVNWQNETSTDLPPSGNATNSRSAQPESLELKPYYGRLDGEDLTISAAAYLNSVDRVRGAVQSGKIPVIHLAAQGTHKNLRLESEQATLIAEKSNIWWRSENGDFSMYLINPLRQLPIRAVDFSYHRGPCSVNSQGEEFSAELLTPITPSSHALIVFGGVDLEKANGCLKVVRLYS